MTALVELFIVLHRVKESRRRFEKEARPERTKIGVLEEFPKLRVEGDSSRERIGLDSDPVVGLSVGDWISR